MSPIKASLSINWLPVPRSIRRALVLEAAKRDLHQVYGNAVHFSGKDIRSYVGIGPAKAAQWDAYRAAHPVEEDRA